VAGGDLLERARDHCHFAEQPHLFILGQIDQLGEARPARHQDEPRVIGVVRQQHARQRQIADRNGIGGELRVEGPGRFGHFVVTGHSRSKNGVSSRRLCPDDPDKVAPCLSKMAGTSPAMTKKQRCTGRRTLPCFPPLLARYKSSGGWRWTSHSPTGSGPEGSSPNERGSG